jgi:hypothetical protein
MLKTLDTVTLRNGEEMVVKLLIPPEAEYSEKLAIFLRHKGDETARDIRARLNGQYASEVIDKYFIGEINGEMAGQLWYGYGRNARPVSNFGHVYTAMGHRRKGITAELMKYFIDDFKNSPALGAFCSSYREWVAAIYQKEGFRALLPGKNAGPMVLANTSVPEDFSKFQEFYYLPAEPVKAVEGSMKYCFEIDALLNYSLQSRSEPHRRIFVSNAVSSLRSALFMQEDKRGSVYCAVTPGGCCAGWSFCLNPLAFGAENQSPVFDWELYPCYRNQARSFVSQSVNKLAKNGTKKIFAYCFSGQIEKISTLESCGFNSIATIPEYCDSQNLLVFSNKL